MSVSNAGRLPGKILVWSIPAVGFVVGVLLARNAGETTKQPFQNFSTSGGNTKQTSRFSASSKVISPLQVQLEDIADHQGTDSLDLQATVQVARSVKGEVRFQWVLPDGAKLTSGQVNGIVPPASANNPWQNSITVSGLAPSQNVKFEVATVINGAVIGATSVYTFPSPSSTGKRAVIRSQVAPSPRSQYPKGVHF